MQYVHAQMQGQAHLAGNICFVAQTVVNISVLQTGAVIGHTSPGLSYNSPWCVNDTVCLFSGISCTFTWSKLVIKRKIRDYLLKYNLYGTSMTIVLNILYQLKITPNYAQIHQYFVFFNNYPNFIFFH